MWKMARVSYSSCTLAGNNPEITRRDDVLMILLMKKPGLCSAETDWKDPACIRCNGPGLDNPSESMHSMRLPIWSWNVRGCHVWHLLEQLPVSRHTGGWQPSRVPSFLKLHFEAFRAFHCSLGRWPLTHRVCHEMPSDRLIAGGAATLMSDCCCRCHSDVTVFKLWVTSSPLSLYLTLA